MQDFAESGHAALDEVAVEFRRRLQEVLAYGAQNAVNRCAQCLELLSGRLEAVRGGMSNGPQDIGPAIDELCAHIEEADRLIRGDSSEASAHRSAAQRAADSLRGYFEATLPVLAMVPLDQAGPDRVAQAVQARRGWGASECAMGLKGLLGGVQVILDRWGQELVQRSQVDAHGSSIQASKDDVLQRRS